MNHLADSTAVAQLATHGYVVVPDSQISLVANRATCVRAVQAFNAWDTTQAPVDSAYVLRVGLRFWSRPRYEDTPHSEFYDFVVFDTAFTYLGVFAK